MEGADDTCGVTAAGIVVNYASLFVTCIASYKIALFVAPLSIGPISILSHDGRILGPADLHLVERDRLGIRADGSKAAAGTPLAYGEVVDIDSLRKAKSAA